MNDIDTTVNIIDTLSKLSSTGALLAILIGFQRKIVVWGWQTEECNKKLETYESLLHENNAKTEARLAEAEARLAEYERHAKAT